MERYKNVLTNGCSFSNDYNSWQALLYEQYKFKLTNLSRDGAGYLYIHNSTISEIAKRNYDLVCIMWGRFEWIDQQVINVAAFDNEFGKQHTYTSNKPFFTKTVDGIRTNKYLHGEEYIENNWVFANNGSNKFLKDIEFCKTQFDNNSRDISISRGLIHLISLQSVLKQKNIPYVFSFFDDYITELQSNPSLYSLLDLSCIMHDHSIRDIGRKLNDKKADNIHYGEKTHRVWANLMIDFIKARYH